MNLQILAMLLSVILPMQSITVSTVFAVNGESMAYQYGGMKTTTYPSVDLQWNPAKPTVEQDVTFAIEFRNPGSSMPKSHIDYSFTISKDGSTAYTVSKHTHSGIDTIKQKLASDGVYKITVTITAIDFNSVTPKTSDFSITVEKSQIQKAEEPVPQPQPKEMPKAKEEEPEKQVKEEKKRMRASLMDESGKRIGIASILQKGTKTFIMIKVKATGISGQVSAWLVAGSNEDTGANNWTKMMNMFVMPIGHSEPAKRMNLFRQNFTFLPTSGDMIVIAIDDCSSGECKPTTNFIAKATLK